MERKWGNFCNVLGRLVGILEGNEGRLAILGGRRPSLKRPVNVSKQIEGNREADEWTVKPNSQVLAKALVNSSGRRGLVHRLRESRCSLSQQRLLGDARAEACVKARGERKSQEAGS